MATYEYANEDLDVECALWQDSSDTWHSKFDKALMDSWHHAMKQGLFSYNLDQVKTRIVPGKMQYVLQLNLLRASKRRPPQYIPMVNTPFDPAKFNFLKVDKKEVIHAMVYNSGNQSESAVPLIINVSPLAEGHVLLVPDIEKCIPQKLTMNAICIGLDVVMLSRHPGMVVGFNSLCALASVNHQHIHAWYCEQPVFVQNAHTVELCEGLWELPQPVPGFVLQLINASLRYDLARKVFAIVDYFQQNEIAHNLYVSYANVISCSNGSSSSTVQVVIWPRKPFVGAKQDAKNIFNVAVAELAGQIPYYSTEGFDTITEEDILEKIRDVRLGDNEYKTLKDKVISVYSNT